MPSRFRRLTTVLPACCALALAVSVSTSLAQPVAAPNAATIVRRMLVRMARLPSGHVVSTLTSYGSAPQSETHWVLDTSSAKQQSTLVEWDYYFLPTRSEPVRRLMGRQTILSVGRRQALRQGSGAWSCVSAPGSSQPSTSGRATSNSAYSLYPPPAGKETYALKGQRTIRSTAVWDVHFTEPPSHGSQGTGDLFIRTKDFVLLRKTLIARRVPASSTGGRVVEKGTVDYSRFGEAVSVKLPADCAR